MQTQTPSPPPPTTTPLRVLGIDPGSRNTGLGVVEVAAGGLRPVAYECIRMGDQALPARLAIIHRGVQRVIAEHRPAAAAVEQVFIANNARSALVLGQASGSAVCSAVIAGLEVVEYSALQIKRAVVGAGNARKEQVQHMVRALLGLRAQPGADEADALACAICHIHTMQVEEKLRRAADPESKAKAKAQPSRPAPSRPAQPATGAPSASETKPANGAAR